MFPKRKVVTGTGCGAGHSFLMTTGLAALSPQLDKTSMACLAIIETPKHSRSKFSYDDATGLFKLSHVLPEGYSFPFDFGFIPSTHAEDGDPLDVIVLLDAPLAVGCLVEVRLLGVIQAVQTEKKKSFKNHRLIAAALMSDSYKDCKSIAHLDAKLVARLEEFFISYNKLRGRGFKVLGRNGPKKALEILSKAMSDHRVQAIKELA